MKIVLAVLYFTTAGVYYAYARKERLVESKRLFVFCAVIWAVCGIATLLN